MIKCPVRLRAFIEKDNCVGYMDCKIRFELFKLSKYRYYKCLYDGRIKNIERLYEVANNGKDN